MSRGFSESIQPSDPRKLRTPPVGTCDGAVAPNIHLMIVSPVRLVREGLAANLQGRENIVAIDAVSLDPSGLARIAQSEPDVVLIDLGQADPAAVSRLVKEASPHTRLVAFALHEIDEDVFACAAAGYCGYVPREGGIDELHRALIDAVGGRMHCAPHIAAAMFNLNLRLLFVKRFWKRSGKLVSGVRGICAFDCLEIP